MSKPTGGPLCAHICVRLDTFEIDTLLKQLGAAAVLPPPAARPTSAIKTKAFTTQVTKDIQVKNNPNSAAPLTEPASKRQKTGYLYDWYAEWNKHAKNGNVGLVPEFARANGTATATWEKFLSTPEYTTLEHFEKYINDLYE